MAWTARHGCDGINRLLLLAPPTKTLPLSQVSQTKNATIPRLQTTLEEGLEPTCDVLAGSLDPYFDRNRLPATARLRVLDNADHFFSGEMALLGTHLDDLLNCAS
jgi:hypothetical protein